MCVCVCECVINHYLCEKCKHTHTHTYTHRKYKS